MIIAVIGDYESPKYKDLLLKIKVLQPEETIIDLSRHRNGDWGKLKHARFTDISNADTVVAGSDWQDHFESRHDIHHAQSLHKDLLIECDGKFFPLSQSVTR
jgi:hypothetical protein